MTGGCVSERIWMHQALEVFQKAAGAAMEIFALATVCFRG